MWGWWGVMLLIGFLTGCFTAWSKGAVRLLMKTLSIPVILVLSRVLFYSRLPFQNSFLNAGIDFVLLSSMALTGDYIVGLKLGRVDKHGYRDDSVGH